MAKGKKSFTKQKKIVVFNEESRREYLLGFSKRKKERQQRAHDALRKKQIQELKEIKQKKRNELIESLRKQQEEYDAMQSDDDDDNNSQDDVPTVDATYEHPEHIVTVTQVCDIDLNGGSTSVTQNKEYPSIGTSIKSDCANQTDKELKNKQYEKKKEKYVKKKKFNHKKRSKESGSTKFKAKKRRKK